MHEWWHGDLVEPHQQTDPLGCPASRDRWVLLIPGDDTRRQYIRKAPTQPVARLSYR